MSEQVIGHLNKILANELAAINQYFAHSKIFSHQGFTKLGEKFKKDSIEEMHHADRLMGRILDLGGALSFQPAKVSIQSTPQAMIEADRSLEGEALVDLKAAVKLAESEQDYHTRDLLVGMIADEEAHKEWLNTQLELINTLGLTAYLQMQVG